VPLNFFQYRVENNAEHYPKGTNFNPQMTRDRPRSTSSKRSVWFLLFTSYLQSTTPIQSFKSFIQSVSQCYKRTKGRMYRNSQCFAFDANYEFLGLPPHLSEVV